jgi:hypothetical protein
MEADDHRLPMSKEVAEQVREVTDAIYRAESRRVFATLVRLLGDLDLAEEALHDAFRAALEQWPLDGVPANPRAWLVSAGRFKAIDGIRRRSRFDSMEDVAEQVDAVKMSVTDGPFAETKEQLAGFYLIDAKDLNEAVQLAAKIPPARVGSVEVRPIRQLSV